MTDDVVILPWKPSFERDLVEICWETGFMGASLSGSGRFEDKRLFAMIFALPYVRYDPGACFVAVADVEGRSRAVGYIIGTSDTAGQHQAFRHRDMPRIAARLALLSWWRHPESARQVMRFSRSEKAEECPAEARPTPFIPSGPDYPAQLHINLLAGWQGRGIGQRLMGRFLGELRARGAPGVFLETSDRNLKALPFYEKLGFSLISRHEGEFWTGEPAQGLVYAMKLQGPRPRCLISKTRRR